MAKRISYHFYLKDKNSTKPTPINFVVNKGSFRKKIGIGESILPIWWDEEKECAVESNRQKKTDLALSKRVNKNINRLREELDELFRDFNGIDKLTPNHSDGEDYLQTLFTKAARIISGQIEMETMEEEEARKTPIKFFEEFIERWSHSPNPRTGILPKSETIWNYKNTLRRYKDYVADNGLKDTFAIFNENFQALFDDYLMNEQELAMNTIVGSHCQLKTMLRCAHEKGLLKDTSFLHWSSKTISFPHVYLTDKELNDLFNLQLTKQIRKENKIGKESHIEESRDLFIVSARTGLRYSDLCHIDTATWIMEEGKETLTILIVKTNDRLTIPLHRQVIEIYNKYNGAMPLPVDKSKYNKHISLCSKLAGITETIDTFAWEKGRPVRKTYKKYELVSSHTGRRSFATNLYLKCKSAHYVMSLTGHTTEENFKRYICVDQKEMAEVVRKYINLDNENDDNEQFESFIRTLKQETLTIAEQQNKIEGLKKMVKSQKQMTAIAEMQAEDAESIMNDLKQALSLGLTMEEYEEYQRKGDGIAGIIERQEVIAE